MGVQLGYIDVHRIDPTKTYQLPEPDGSVTQQGGEGRVHWAMKASIVAWLRGIDGVSGKIEPETKVGDLIPDVKCTLNSSIDGLPERCIFEIQTRETMTDLVKRIRRLHRHGYSVYYVFPENADNHRQCLTERLSEEMVEQPDLGRVTADGEICVGTPLKPGSLGAESGLMPWGELRIPTHKRSAQAYDFGDFLFESVRTALVSIDGYIYTMSEIDTTGQRTLPMPPSLSKRELYRQMMNGEITRESPVRGTPQGR